MNIKLNNADFSANGISTIVPTYIVDKINGKVVADLGGSFENGQRLRFRVVIDDASTYAGTTVNFAWAVGPSATNYQIGTYMNGAPQFSITLQNGASFVGGQTVGKLSATNPNVKISIFNVSAVYRAVIWHVEYYVETA